MFYTYIIQSQTTGKLYIGHTENIEQRINDHNLNRSRYTRFKGPWKIIFIRVLESRGEAMKLENQLKQFKSSKYILEKFVPENS
ncbi:MAG: GIY-YIG nuclease family protein [Bacteroidia bacterium]|nr:GIY-YIG nuclease family protein [Bacteroidia bacterium]